MQLRPDEMILFRNTMKISEGHVDAFKRAIQEAVEFVSRNGPQLMVQTFIDEEQLTAISYQLYRDSEAILEHWRLADPYIAEVMRHCTVAAFEIHGEPNAVVMERMNAMLQDGRAIQMWRLAGFVRL
jgi:quinol monooxygenase YgiN